MVQFSFFTGKFLTTFCMILNAGYIVAKTREEFEVF